MVGSKWGSLEHCNPEHFGLGGKACMGLIQDSIDPKLRGMSSSLNSKLKENK